MYSPQVGVNSDKAYLQNLWATNLLIQTFDISHYNTYDVKRQPKRVKCLFEQAYSCFPLCLNKHHHSLYFLYSQTADRLYCKKVKIRIFLYLASTSCIWYILNYTF